MKSFINSINISPVKIEFKTPIFVNKTLLHSQSAHLISGDFINNETFKVVYGPISGFHNYNTENDLKVIKGQKDLHLLSPYGSFIQEIIELNHKMKERNFNVQSNLLITNIEELDRLESFSSSLKLKVATIETHKEIIAINNFLKHNPNALLRLDANRSLSVKQLNEFIENIPSENIEYFEEPTSSPNDWCQYLDRKVSFALDEHLEDFLENPPENCTHFVIKPSLGLGIKKTLALIEQKKQTVVISSAYNAPENHFALEYLAHQQNLIKPTPAGLDTLKYFK